MRECLVMALGREGREGWKEKERKMPVEGGRGGEDEGKEGR